jgi:hypothetical protein
MAIALDALSTSTQHIRDAVAESRATIEMRALSVAVGPGARDGVFVPRCAGRLAGLVVPGWPPRAEPIDADEDRLCV